jgi:beta-exotoxin I transport system ATP-binding protein
MLDLIRPTSGRVWLLGRDVRAGGFEVRRQVGYLPGELALYEQLTGRELLAYLANLRGGRMRRADELAERLDLDLSRHVHDLSRGNRQKLGVVQAFMHDPEVAILDEPTSGLDPLVQQEFHRIVREVVAKGRTVFLSSHVLSETERVADRVGIIREGRLVLVERLEILRAMALRRLELDFAAPVPAAAFANLPGVHDLTVAGRTVRCSVVGSVDALIKAAASFEILNVTSHEPDLEEIFLTYFREAATDAAA